MKVPVQFELLVEKGIPKLVDVSKFGKKEGFRKLEDLRVACIGLCADKPEVAQKIYALFDRLENKTLLAGDVVGPENRDMMDKSANPFN